MYRLRSSRLRRLFLFCADSGPRAYGACSSSAQTQVLALTALVPLLRRLRSSRLRRLFLFCVDSGPRAYGACSSSAQTQVHALTAPVPLLRRLRSSRLRAHLSADADGTFVNKLAKNKCRLWRRLFFSALITLYHNAS